MTLYGLARKANRYVKDYKKRRAGRFVSLTRRIERVFPPAERVCAMTFDDGPSAVLPEGFDAGLTEHLASVLKDFGARATFDIIGDTSENYPDTAGDLGGFYWGGKKFDHYPFIGMDDMGGARHFPELCKMLKESGHELSNHGYRHVLFGPMRTVYRSRSHFESLGEVVSDLRRLHQLVESAVGVTMRLARPPHYIDGIRGGLSSYDAYEIMGYNYMAASFDGGGWMGSCGDRKKDAEAMVAPLRAALERDPDALCGQIIFQKDGFNMSRETPVADALPIQLRLLSERGYRVIPVSELLELSPFEDLDPSDDCVPAVLELLRDGAAVGYRNNTFQPLRTATVGEAVMLLTPKAEISRRLELRDGKCPPGTLHPYSTAMRWAVSEGLCAAGERDDPLHGERLFRLLASSMRSSAKIPDGAVSRRELVLSVAGRTGI